MGELHPRRRYERQLPQGEQPGMELPQGRQSVMGLPQEKQLVVRQP